MITINLLRISPDNKYLQINATCPTGYTFNKLYIKKYDYIPLPTTLVNGISVEDDGWRDFSSILTTDVNQVINMSTLIFSNLSITPDSLGNSASTMFYVQFGVTGSGEILPDVIGIASNLNNTYLLLKDNLLNLDANCIKQEELQEVIRNYMFMFAHSKAIELYRSEDAELFYNIIKKSFKSCQSSRDSNSRDLNSCNCK